MYLSWSPTLNFSLLELLTTFFPIAGVVSYIPGQNSLLLTIPLLCSSVSRSKPAIMYTYTHTTDSLPCTPKHSSTYICIKHSVAVLCWPFPIDFQSSRHYRHCHLHEADGSAWVYLCVTVTTLHPVTASLQRSLPTSHLPLMMYLLKGEKFLPTSAQGPAGLCAKNAGRVEEVWQSVSELLSVCCAVLHIN